MSPEEKIMVVALKPIKPKPIGWTDERIDLTKKLWADGLSASQIAAELGGITRNAVIGKLARMGITRGLKKRQAAAPPSNPRIRKSRTTVAFVGMSPKKLPPPEPYHSTLSADDIPRQQRKTIATLGEKHCRFPFGDVGHPDFFFCGAIREDPHIPIERGGIPYCAPCARIAYVPQSTRKQWRDVDWRIKVNDPPAKEGFSGLRWGGKHIRPHV